MNATLIIFVKLKKTSGMEEKNRHPSNSPHKVKEKLELRENARAQESARERRRAPESASRAPEERQRTPESARERRRAPESTRERQRAPESAESATSDGDEDSARSWFSKRPSHGPPAAIPPMSRPLGRRLHDLVNACIDGPCVHAQCARPPNFV